VKNKNVPTLDGFIKLEVFDADGKRIKIRRFKMRSYVMNMTELLYLGFIGATGAYAVKDTSDVNRSPNNPVKQFRLAAAAGNATLGIQVGTDATAVAITQTKLIVPIAEGVGAGQLNYQLLAVTVPATIGSRRYTLATRSFVNNSGNTIIVREIGMIVDQDDWKFLIARDICTAEQGTILNTQTLAVTYDIGVTV